MAAAMADSEEESDPSADSGPLSFRNFSQPASYHVVADQLDPGGELARVGEELAIAVNLEEFVDLKGLRFQGVLVHLDLDVGVVDL